MCPGGPWNDRHRPGAHCRRPVAESHGRLRAVGGQDPGARSAMGSGRRRAGVHRGRPLPRPRLDRVDAGLPVRLGDAAVRRHRRHAHSSSSAARAPSSGWRRTSRTSACTTTASTTSAPTAACGGSRARAGSTRSEWELRFYELALKVSGAVQARALDARCPTAATSTRSTARTRCSSTRSARCARWRSRTCSAIA